MKCDTSVRGRSVEQKRHAKRIELFLLFYALRFFPRKLLYIAVLVNLACNEAKFLLSGHVNVMLSKVQPNAYESVVFW